MNITDAMLEEYFNRLHASQWGRSFDLWQESSREEAKEFIRNLVTSVEEISDDSLIGSMDPE